MQLQDIVIEALIPLDNLIEEISKLADDLDSATIAQSNRLSLLVATEIYRLADTELKVGTLSSAYHQEAKELDKQLKELVKAKVEDPILKASFSETLKLADECQEWRRCLETKKSAAKEAIMVLKKITDSKREGVC